MLHTVDAADGIKRGSRKPECALGNVARLDPNVIFTVQSKNIAIGKIYGIAKIVDQSYLHTERGTTHRKQTHSTSDVSYDGILRCCASYQIYVERDSGHILKFALYKGFGIPECERFQHTFNRLIYHVIG
jgi:hypothetical protein